MSRCTNPFTTIKGEHHAISMVKTKLCYLTSSRACLLPSFEVCRTLEQQKGMPAEEFVQNINTAVTNLPHDPSRPMIEHILANIAQGLDGKPLAPLHIE